MPRYVPDFETMLYMNQRITCDICKQQYTRGYMPKHKQSKKHIENMSK